MCEGVCSSVDVVGCQSPEVVEGVGGVELHQTSQTRGNRQNHYTCSYFVSFCMRKPTFWVFHQAGHRLACTVTEEGLKLLILYLRRRGIVLSV